MLDREPIVVVPYDPAWRLEFIEIGRKIRIALGDAALRIHHIGSTSIEGLVAKPIIDIQISIQSLEPAYRYVDGKDPIIWEIMLRASKWSQKTGWKAGESDI